MLWSISSERRYKDLHNLEDETDYRQQNGPDRRLGIYERMLLKLTQRNMPHRNFYRRSHLDSWDMR